MKCETRISILYVPSSHLLREKANGQKEKKK